MSEDFVLSGIYIHPLLVAACLAFAAAELGGWVLSRLGFYRFVWHRGLFDVALTLVLWAGIATLLSGGSLTAAYLG